MTASLLAICVGACIGAVSRWQLGLWLNPSPLQVAGTVIPMGTVAANLIGAYLVGVCVAVFQTLPQLDPLWRLGLITGFLGALTTFSTFSSEVVSMLLQQRYALALVTASLHLLGSLLLTLTGIISAKWLLGSH